MQRKKTLAARLMLTALFAGSLSLTACDFGNQTNDTTSAGTEEGTIQEGDNADDKQAEKNEEQPDTTGVGSFN